MMLLDLDPNDTYVPFVSSRHEAGHLREVRRLETRVGGSRRVIGRALIRAGRAVAGLGGASTR
jgi:hypothetical protein